MYNVRLVPFCHICTTRLCSFKFECALINVTICRMVLTSQKTVWYYIQGKPKKTKDNAEIKTQAPPPSGSGGLLLIFSGSFPSRPVPGF